MKKNKILIVIPSLKIGGGAEKVACLVANELSKKYEVKVLTFYKFMQENNVQCPRYCHDETIGKSRFSKLKVCFKRLLFLRKIYADYEPDLVVSFLSDANVFSLLSSFKANHKLVLSVRSDINRYNFLYKKVISYLYSYADIVHAITNKMEFELNKLGIRNTVVIPNTHDLAKYELLANEKPSVFIPQCDDVFLNIGRLNIAKGQWHLVKAFSLVAKKNKNAKLYIVGDGELKRELTCLIDSLGITNNVIITGYISNVFPLIKRADCFVFTSLYEGLPNVLIECLALGKKIISTDCISGPREVLAPDLDINLDIDYPYSAKYGKLISPYSMVDSPDLSVVINDKDIVLANEMLRSVSNKDESNLLVQSAKDRYSINVTLGKWFKLIDSIL